MSSNPQTDVLGVGVIGCGNISQWYLKRAPEFNGMEIRACADINPEAAQLQAAEHGIRAQSVDELLANDQIDIVLNLTIPAAHYAVSRAILSAGKHVYSEKPLVLNPEEGLALQGLAREKNLRIGSAPDTFLGGSHQYARQLVDQGAIGKITSGTCHVMSHGMEHWHPNPDFFFKPGGGPILDLGPYYLANLVQLIGPASRVVALSAIPSEQRTIGNGPRIGETIRVETATTVHALIEFANGAIITLGASWDVWSHGHRPMELYGSEGTLIVPDPNFFGGQVQRSDGQGTLSEGPSWDHPLGVANRETSSGMMVADYRSAGLADMALAITQGRPHRCSLDLALHCVEIMSAVLTSGETGRFVELQTRCQRPEPLGIEDAVALRRPAAV